MTQSTQLRMIPESESFSAQTKYLGNKKVSASFSVRRDAKSARYCKEATFDFSNVTEEELYALAMYSAKVKVQSILRALSPEVMLRSDTLQQIDVKRDLLEAEKSSGDPATQAVKSIMRATGLPEDAAKALLDQAKTKAAAQKPQPKVKVA
jgi:hypothetical protein